MLVSGRVVARSFGRRVSEYPLFHDTPSTHGKRTRFEMLAVGGTIQFTLPFGFWSLFRSRPWVLKDRSIGRLVKIEKVVRKQQPYCKWTKNVLWRGRILKGNESSSNQHLVFRGLVFHRIHGTGKFTYMNAWFLWDQLGKYTSPMDPMGMYMKRTDLYM